MTQRRFANGMKYDTVIIKRIVSSCFSIVPVFRRVISQAAFPWRDTKDTFSSLDWCTTLRISRFLHFRPTDLSRFTGGFVTRTPWGNFSGTPARATQRVSRTLGSRHGRTRRVLPPWYRLLRISPLNHSRLRSPMREPGFRRLPSSCLLLDDGGSSSLSAPHDIPMRMWVRPPCDLSMPGEHNTGEGRGRKRRVATGVSKIVEKFGVDFPFVGEAIDQC